MIFPLNKNNSYRKILHYPSIRRMLKAQFLYILFQFYTIEHNFKLLGFTNAKNKKNSFGQRKRISQYHS